MTDKDFEKEIRAVRNQGWSGSYGPYTTPVEQSCAAADYLIVHAGQPQDFDLFHEEFQIIMDKGGQIFHMIRLTGTRTYG